MLQIRSVRSGLPFVACLFNTKGLPPPASDLSIVCVLNLSSSTTTTTTTMSAELQSSTRPPAQPSYVFRGHVAPIHSVQIVRRNTRLVTGDADGCIVLWKLESKRPVAVWQAHDGAILGTAEWGLDKVAT